MSEADDNRPNSYGTSCCDGDLRLTPHRKKSRETYNIQFVNGLEDEAVIELLQYELLRARSKGVDSPEVSLPASLVHNLKFRLGWYMDNAGNDDSKRPPVKTSWRRSD